MASQKPITIAAVGPKHTATLIVAHGLGDSGAGWVFLAEEWIMAKKFDYVKFVFPNAPSIPITIVRRNLLRASEFISRGSALLLRSFGKRRQMRLLRALQSIHYVRKDVL